MMPPLTHFASFDFPPRILYFMSTSNNFEKLRELNERAETGGGARARPAAT